MRDAGFLCAAVPPPRPHACSIVGYTIIYTHSAARVLFHRSCETLVGVSGAGCTALISRNKAGSLRVKSYLFTERAVESYRLTRVYLTEQLMHLRHYLLLVAAVVVRQCAGIGCLPQVCDGNVDNNLRTGVEDHFSGRYNGLR